MTDRHAEPWRHKSPAERKDNMYHVYKLLTDEKGTIVHKTPVAKCGNLKAAVTHARVWSNGWPMGIYEIKPDGSEVRVY
ncbi:MAG: hypothetical protein ACI4WX_06270 [Aristaeellaceae bacterium]